MGKVFGYPEYNAEGEKVLTTYDNDYKEMLMDVRLFLMKSGQVKKINKTHRSANTFINRR